MAIEKDGISWLRLCRSFFLPWLPFLYRVRTQHMSRRKSLEIRHRWHSLLQTVAWKRSERLKIGVHLHRVGGCFEP